MAKTMRMTYSTIAIPIWVRAVSLMPITAMAIMISPSAVSIPMFPQVAVELEPNTASTDGASTSTPLRVPITKAATISQPVRKPRYGLMARPTHSKDAPALASHMLSLR
jgi:hypothetical protein